MKAFLDEYPESEHTVDVADTIFYRQGVEGDDLEGAIAYVQAIREKISDDQIASDLDVRLARMYGRAGMADDLIVLGERLAVSDRLSFNQHMELIRAAVEVDGWDIVKTSCENAREFANADTYRADYPSNVFSDEEAEAKGKNRLGMILTYQGWAKANSGQVEEALADFEMADGLVTKNFLGISDYPLNVYWGKTLMLEDKHNEAFERMAVDGLIARNEDAHEALMKSYVAFNGTAEGFGDYATSYQRKVAKTLDDFTLPGFSDGEYSLSDLKGDVTLLVFWHPT
jgi:hypothetical protein